MADHHDKPYEHGTLLKLNFFEDYIEAWLPVFLNTPSVKSINIFDFFCGPGYDINSNLGSPIRALRAIGKFKESLIKNNKKVSLYLNDKSEEKIIQLKSIIGIIDDVVNVNISSKNYEDAFFDLKPILTRKGTANFVF